MPGSSWPAATSSRVTATMSVCGRACVSPRAVGAAAMARRLTRAGPFVEVQFGMGREGQLLEVLLPLERGDGPLHAQVERALRDAIRGGRLLPRTALPS